MVPSTKTLTKAETAGGPSSNEDAYGAVPWYPDQEHWICKPGACSAAYNYPLPFHIRGPLDIPVLERAFKVVLTEHPVLRSTFRVADGRVFGVIRPSAGFLLPVSDFSALKERQRQEELTEVAHRHACEAFDLATEVPLRARIVRLQSEEHVLLLTTHHIVCDDWSSAIVCRDLFETYQAISSKQNFPERDSMWRYGEFVRDRETEAQKKNLTLGLSFWTDRLAGNNGFRHLPGNGCHERPSHPVRSSYRGAHERIVIPDDLTKAITKLSQRQRVTTFMTLVAAFQTLLHIRSRDEDIGVGSCVANRSSIGLDNVVGPFANVIILRTRFHAAPTFLEILDRTRDVALTAYSYQDVPLGSIVKVLRPNAHPGSTPLFQSAFTLQNAPREKWHLRDIEVESWCFDGGLTPYEINVCVRAGEHLEFDLQYDVDLFDASTIQKLLQDYRELLKAVAVDPSRRIADLANGIASISVKAESPKAKTLGEPVDEVEGQLLNIWQSLLPGVSISRTADFFECGGHSLSAARLFTRIEQAFKVQLAPSALLVAPSVAQLAQLIRAKGIREDHGSPWLVSVQPRGSRTPIFFMHDVEGSVLYARQFSQRLGSDCPVFALQFAGTPDAGQDLSVPEMAATYAQEIRKAQRRGPYYLCGHCAGGVVAYEVARQLSAQGAAVALLAMINSPVPTCLQRTATGQLRHLAQRSILMSKKMRRCNFTEALEFIRHEGNLFVAKFTRTFRGRLSDACRSQNPGQGDSAKHLYTNRDAITEALKRYVPEPYSGRISFFVSANPLTPLLSRQALRKWSALATGGFQLFEFSGEDDSVYQDPHFGCLIEKLKTCL